MDNLTRITYIYDDGTQATDLFTPDEIKVFQANAGIGRVRDDITGIILEEIASGCSTPVLEFANGFCEHTLTSYAPGEEGITCDFCGAFIRPLSADEYNGMFL